MTRLCPCRTLALMFKAKKGRGWEQDEERLRALDRQLHRTEGAFSWTCPCGSKFSVEGGQDGAGKVDAISQAHLATEHPGVLEEIEEMKRLGVSRDFAELFLQQWRKGVRSGG